MPVRYLNSSNTPLVNNDSFQGPFEALSGREDSIVISLVASHNATLTIDFSSNGSDVDSTTTRSYRADRLFPPARFTLGADYYRVRVLNDSGSDQAFMRLQTVAGNKNLTNYPTDSVLPHRADAIGVRGDFYKHEVMLGRREGIVGWHQPGYMTDADTSGVKTVWQNNTRLIPLPTAQVINISSTSVNDDLTGTGTRQLGIIGVGPGYTYQEEEIDMDGTTIAPTQLTWLGINHAEQLTAGSGQGNAGIITGVGAVSATTQFYIAAGIGVTEHAFYFCPIDRTFMLDLIWLSTLKQIGINPVVTIDGYLHDFTNSTVTRRFQWGIDTTIDNTIPLDLGLPLPIDGGQMIEFTALSSADNTIVSLGLWGIDYEDA